MDAELHSRRCSDASSNLLREIIISAYDRYFISAEC